MGEAPQACEAFSSIRSDQEWMCTCGAPRTEHDHAAIAPAPRVVCEHRLVDTEGFCTRCNQEVSL